jgi:polar amino acid transport system substrate-binding protein
VAWQNARGDLGDKFTRIVAGNDHYKEISSQQTQVKFFLAGHASVIVIDKDIFSWHVKTQGAEFNKSINDYEFHKIVPGFTNLYLGFRNKGLRDEFDKALRAMKEDGTYRKIIDSYVK